MAQGSTTTTTLHLPTDLVANDVFATIPTRTSAELETELRRTCDEVPIRPGGLFALLTDRYGESHRHHHSLDHVSDCLVVADRIAAAYDTKPSVATRFALWFHDAIFDPRARDNEERSATLAASELWVRGATHRLCDDVEHLILTTVTHRTTAIPAPTDPGFDSSVLATIEFAAAMVCDADLAVLGFDEATYDRYRIAVRNEYEFRDDKSWARGRSRILTKLPSYATGPARVGRSRAAENIAHELASFEAHTHTTQVTNH